MRSSKATSYKLIERPIYGSRRVGIDNTEMELIGYTAPTSGILAHVLGLKQYELSNHLGNVLTTVTDKKIPVDVGNDGTIDYYVADITSASDYYPFGSPMDGRTFSSDTYRFGFNGKENEVKGEGNQQDYGMRIYDSRLCKFLSADPLIVCGKMYPELSTYQFASNTPIMAIDLDGKEAYYAANGKFIAWGELKGDDAPVILVSYKTVGIKIQRIETTLQIRDRNLTHLEFQQVAAYAYNETYSGQTEDKYRVANTIVNSDGFYKNATFQETLDRQAGNNDTHDKRLKNIRDIAGTNSKAYASYFETDVQTRNSNNDMTESNAAAINAFRKDGVDYTLSADGKHRATNWLGKKGNSLVNRCFYRKSKNAIQLIRIKLFKNKKS